MASLYEQFTGQDWERGSLLFGQIATAGCVVTSIISMALGYNIGVGIWTLLVGLIIAIWETPIVYSCIPKCEDIRKTTEEVVYMGKPLVRAFLYVLLSILCYTQKTICIAAGILLNLSSLLYIFAAINARADAIDGLTTDEDVSESGVGGTKPLVKKEFGTFSF